MMGLKSAATIAAGTVAAHVGTPFLRRLVPMDTGSEAGEYALSGAVIFLAGFLVRKGGGTMRTLGTGVQAAGIYTAVKPHLGGLLE